MKKGFIVFVCTFLLLCSSCSLFLVDISKGVRGKNDEDNKESTGVVEILNLKAVTNNSGTTLFWDNFYYFFKKEKRYIKHFTIYRSSKSPWEGFTEVESLFTNSSEETENTRNYWTDTSVTSDTIETYFYRIRFDYEVVLGDNDNPSWIYYKCLSEAVQVP